MDMEFGGMRVIESQNLTEAGEPYHVRRSWRERLFSRPWRPFQATYMVTPQIPYRGAVQIDKRTLVMHPAIVRQLRSQTDREAR